MQCKIYHPTTEKDNFLTPIPPSNSVSYSSQYNDPFPGGLDTQHSSAMAHSADAHHNHYQHCLNKHVPAPLDLVDIVSYNIATDAE